MRKAQRKTQNATGMTFHYSHRLINRNDIFSLFFVSRQCCLCLSLPAEYLQAARNQQMNTSNRRGGSKPHAFGLPIHHHQGIVSLWFPQDDGSFRL
ncbi:hypothetical protein I7I53_06905 [Histoplasma capsulatum var. duboisii H88]|uniref:Uncharacterized protein n=1 Tax=Ajellomyces capsulatus (strain H88) TaxID=544711 RepID=A0A8A1LCQ6_AJEC8|nr:hypothetical protein I7I53_06905 [Histoplasma capsulatum var. duboisii H88]